MKLRKREPRPMRLEDDASLGFHKPQRDHHAPSGHPKPTRATVLAKRLARKEQAA